MADLLSREGHPLASRVLAAARDRRPDKHDPKALVEPSFAPRRTLGIAAGAALVLGTVVAGAFGLGHGHDPAPTAGSGEPLGALPVPGRSTPPQQQQAPPAAEAAQQQPQFVNAASTERVPLASQGPFGQIGVPATVAPPVAKAPRANPPAQQPNQQPPAAQAPAAPATGPVQSLSEPVTNTVGGGTLTGVVAPVTQTVDNTLQPALSLIGGLLGHH